MTDRHYPTAEDAIADLLCRAYYFDDKPHQLFSCIMRIAEQFNVMDEMDKKETIALMDRAYENIGKAREVWESK